MVDESNRDQESWHLGPDPTDSQHPSKDHYIEPVEAELAQENRYDGLDHPLYVVTVERAALFAIAGWALVTRLIALGMRPLNRSEALHALLDLQVADAGRDALHDAIDPLSTFMHLLGATIFHLMPPDDFSARIGVAGCGLLLVAIAFSMRPWLGRAGTITFAALLAISPSFTWFSRANEPPIVAGALTLLAFRLGLEFFAKATIRKALALGLSVGVALSISPDLVPTLMIFVVVAIVIALSELLFTLEFGERLLFWITSNKASEIAAVLSAAIAWLTLATGLFAHPLPAIDVRMLVPWTIGGYRDGLLSYLPALGLYEFLTVLLAAAGLGLFGALRIKSRLAGWTFLWALAALAIFPLCPVRNYLIFLQMLLPLWLMAALAVDYCYRSKAWRFIGYPIAALGVYTIYVQLMANFVHAVADAGEARSSRHAPLFWTEAATTIGARDECNKIEDLYDNEGTLASRSFFDSTDSPALQWYLRDLNPADKAQSADVTAVASDGAPLGESAPTADRENVTFDLQDTWQPDWSSATVVDLVRYLFTVRTWGTIESQQVTLSYAAAIGSPATASPASTPSEPTESESLKETPAIASSPPPLPSNTPAANGSPAGASSVPASTASAATPSATPASPTASPTPTAATSL